MIHENRFVSAKSKAFRPNSITIEQLLSRPQTDIPSFTMHDVDDRDHSPEVDSPTAMVSLGQCTAVLCDDWARQRGTVTVSLRI